MIEYWKIFLEEIKALLHYFVKFREDDTIFPKEYSDNYIFKSSNRQLIIIITYDESIFSTNNSRQKGFDI